MQLDDFLHGIRGKADEYKIMRISDTVTSFEKVIAGKKHIKMIFTDNFLPEDPLDIYRIFLYIVANIQDRCPQKKIWVSLEQCGYDAVEFQGLLQKTLEMDKPEFVLPEVIVSDPGEDIFDLELKLCEHVKLVKQPVLPQIYIDKFCNCITSEEEYEYFKSYSVNEKLLKDIYRPLVMQAVKNIRNDRKKEE